MPTSLTRLVARAVLATTAVDRAAQRFNQWRSRLVLAFASDEFLDAYGEAAFSTASAYRADSRGFREGLFGWEEAAVRQFFPPPPAHILIGGAGGGREPFALTKMGYRVTAFDPAVRLVEAMVERARQERVPGLRPLCGGYEHLPQLPAAGSIAGGDLSSEPPFDAAILGWTSLSHLPSDQRRVEALTRMASLTRGPLLISYFSPNASQGAGVGGVGVRGWLDKRAARRGHAMFTPSAGYARLLTAADVRAMAAAAGLEVVHIDNESSFPNAILADGHLRT